HAPRRDLHSFPTRRSSDLAILDWMMPKMDGVQVCRELSRVPHPKSIYIILLTAKGRREDVVAGLQAGANDYITKPFCPEELRARSEEHTSELQSLAYLVCR